MLGQSLDCLLCDKREFPEGLTEYKRTPIFTTDSIPTGLKRDHSTKEGVWGRICVLAGKLEYSVTLPQPLTLELEAGDEGVVVPEMPHSVQALGEVRFYVSFHKRDDTRCNHQ
jgi:tellurite methyltransferase